MEMKINGLTIVLALLIGVLIGQIWTEHRTYNRYIRALAERHEADAHYWDVKTNEILTNNTLEAQRRKQQ